MHAYLLVARAKHTSPQTRYRKKKVQPARLQKSQACGDAHQASPLPWAPRRLPSPVTGGRTVPGDTGTGTSALTDGSQEDSTRSPGPAPLCPALCWCLGVRSRSSSALQHSYYCCPFCLLLCSLLLLFCLTSVNFSSFLPPVLACMNFLCLYSFNNSHVLTPPYPSTTRCSSVVSAHRSRGRREAWARGLNLNWAPWELFLVRDHSSLETLPH